jgi:hypothetical protein
MIEREIKTEPEKLVKRRKKLNASSVYQLVLKVSFRLFG